MFSSKVFRSMLPKSSLFRPIPNGDYDKTIDSIGEITSKSTELGLKCSTLRNGNETIMLNDLEREFAILKNNNLSESNRRMQLSAKQFSPPGRGTATDLQSMLDNAGFNLFVYKNNPNVDPEIFVNENFQMVAGGDNAYAGRPDAYAGQLGGYYLVNGPVYDQEPAYIMQAGGSIAYAGNGNAISGRFDGLKKIEISYGPITDPNVWRFVFFVGGIATRDPITNEITEIEQGLVPLERRSELEKIILQIKPTYTWAAMIVTYI